MTICDLSKNPKYFAGAAMAESILILGVLTTFMLGIPMLGTLIDTKQTTIQASRYAAWENTVYKTPEDVVDQVDTRFFRHTETPISSNLATAPSHQLWGEEISTGGNGSTAVPEGLNQNADGSTPPVAGGGLQLYNRARVSIFDASVEKTNAELELGSIAGTTSSAVFTVTRALSSDGWDDLKQNGLYRSNVSVAIQENELYTLGVGGCGGGAGFTCLSEATSLMIDGWSSGDTLSTKDRVHGFVPTNRLDTVGNYLSKLGAIPMLTDLKGVKNAFGCVKNGVLPPKELSETGNPNLPAYEFQQGDNC